MQIRANNKNLKDVTDKIKHADELMYAAGWHTTVKNLEKHWIFDFSPDSHQWRCGLT